jgi:hemolysin III
MEDKRKTEYLQAKGAIELKYTSSQVNIESSYKSSCKSHREAKKALEIREREESHQFREAKAEIEKQRKEELKALERAYKKGEPLESFLKKSASEPIEKPEAEKEESQETVEEAESKPNNDYTVCLTGEQAAYLRKINGLPRYTHGEEVFNAVTHIVGGGLGVVYLVVGVIFGWLKRGVPGATTMAVFGVCTIFLYTMSAIYHALNINKAKKVFQIIDHCTIYVLIAGSYTPVCVLALNQIFPWNYVLLGGIYLFGALGIVLNATMMDKMPVKIVSNFLYLCLGWVIVCFWPWLYQGVGLGGVLLFLGGGICYTVGAIFYALGRNVKYFHSIFHIWVLLGTLLQFLSILLYPILGL